MKLLLLNQAFYPDNVATAQYVTDIAKYLVCLGHDVSVLCDRRDYTKRTTVYSAFETYEGIRIHRVSSLGLGKHGFISRMADAVAYEIMVFWTLAARIPRHDAVIAFTSPPLAGLQGALIAKIWRARFLHWIMNVNHRMAIEIGYLRPSGLIAIVLSWLYRFTLRRANKIIVMDRWMKSRAENEVGIDQSRIITIPLWPVHEDALDVSDAPSSELFRNSLGLVNKFVVAHSGNLSVIHPLDTVLAAAVRLKNDPSIAFVFFGYGVRESDIDQCIHRHGLTNVIKAPYQPREMLGRALQCADLQLIVMGNAASGLAHSSKIYSILSSGRPFLFIGPANCHIVCDVILPGNIGYHIEHGDVDGFLRVINLVKNLTPEERRDRGQRSMAFVANNFSRACLLQRFVNEALLEECGESEK